MSKVVPSGTDLSKSEWVILDALEDDIEPIEEVARYLRNYNIQLPPNGFLEISFCLFQRGFIRFKQAPIEVFGQSFLKRYLRPEKPGEIVEDLADQFHEAYTLEDYLLYASVHPDFPPAGVPLGIYYILTPEGRAEWEKPTYRRYWPPDPQ